MESRILSLLSCPEDHGRLELSAVLSSGTDAMGGQLRCVVCQRAYPIDSGIPRFLTAEQNDLSPLQRSELVIRDREYLAGQGGKIDAWHAPEFDALKVAVGDCGGLAVLDAGCGVGKFNRIFKHADCFLGVDLSWEGLVRFQKPDHVRTGLIQGDVTQMPVEDHSFDLALSLQVLSHLPTADLRANLLSELARVLKADGRLIITVMHYSFRYRRRMIPQEAEEDGSFYHRFEVSELRDLLSKRFTIRALHGYWIYLPKTYWLFMALGRWRAYWDRIWRTRPLSLTYGKYLLAVCSPKKG
jgi:SAM-dependent methyltransferase